MERSKKISILCFILLGLATSIHAQEKNNTIRLGLNYGSGSQQANPFNQSEYFHENNYIKIQFNYPLKQKRKWMFELNIEPGLYFSKYQGLSKENALTIATPSPTVQNGEPDAMTIFNEYVLNFGLLARYTLLKDVSIYFLGSVGPMISGAGTGRLAKGFAFSDIVALGTSYILKNVRFDVRFSLRHVSNASLAKPNAGHDSFSFETGFSFAL